MLHNNLPRAFATSARDGLMSKEDKELLSNSLPDQINNNRADIDYLKNNRIPDVEDLANLAFQTAINKVSAIPFDTKDDLDAWLAIEANKANLKVGTTLLIRELDTPDYWWDGETIQILETQKVDLSGYLKLSGGKLTGNLEGTTATFSGLITASGGIKGDLTGTADVAKKLSNTSAIGSATKPVYFSASGVPVATTYFLNADILCNTGSLSSGGWKTLGGRTAGSKITAYYASSSPATWNSSSYSAGIVFGAQDTKGMLDCAYSTPKITFGGGSTANSTDNAPAWYFSLIGTSGKTYTFPSSSCTLATSDHTHSYLALSGGKLTGNLEGTTATFSGLITANGKVKGDLTGTADNSKKTYTDIIKPSTATWYDVVLKDRGSDYYYQMHSSDGGFLVQLSGTTANLKLSGTITGSKVYNAVWNDYAEWFEKEDIDEEFEPGDIVTWVENGVSKTTEYYDDMVVGVCSNSYGHIVGGEQLDNMEDNNKKFVPIGLCGRVYVKVTGKVERGNIIVSSDIPGVGIGIKPEDKCNATSVGKALENKTSDGIGLVKIMIMLS